MKYVFSFEWTMKAKDMARKLSLSHVDLDRISVIVSRGSKSRRTIARIHGMAKAMQKLQKGGMKF